MDKTAPNTPTVKSGVKLKIAKVWSKFKRGDSDVLEMKKDIGITPRAEPDIKQTATPKLLDVLQ